MAPIDQEKDQLVLNQIIWKKQNLNKKVIASQEKPPITVCYWNILTNNALPGCTKPKPRGTFSAINDQAVILWTVYKLVFTSL